MESTSKFAYWGTTSEEILTNNFPLHKACRDGDVEALSKLLIHAQHGIYVEDNFYGWTPAHWCAYFGHLACLKKLMSVTRIGAECNINTTRFQQTPAHLAAFGGHPQCLQWLIESNADIEIQDYLGETPIHKAARSGSMACVSILASNGSRLYMKNNNNQTAADLAAVAGYAECAEFLTRGAQMQEHLPVPGVYNGENSKSGSCTVIDPSPHDVTLTEKFHPCVGNGTVSQSSDMEMEDDSEPHGAMGTALSPRAQTRDITIDLGVSKNQVPIAGRKRSREESDEVGDCFKRIRTQDAEVSLMSTNGAMQQTSMLKHMNGFVSEPEPFEVRMPFASPTTENGTSNPPLAIVNGVRKNQPYISNSSLEHEHSVIVEQGYDSMFCESML